MPLQPYSQPSGPHVSALNTLCLALRSQPSSNTTGGPSGLSLRSLSGMNKKFGVAQSQTPPKPYSMPAMFVPLSQKTFFESKCPSLLESSKITMRSFPELPSVIQAGYVIDSTTHSRPRSSNVNAIGCTTSGSPANSDTLKPFGTVIFAADSETGTGRGASSAHVTPCTARPATIVARIRHVGRENW